MPFYTLACRRPLPQETRESIANAVTDTHCNVTQAPPEFVNVAFMDGHPVRDGKAIGVIGNVRSGGNRDASLLDELQQQIHCNVAAAAELSEDEISVRLIGVPASWIMEGGKILPEPGSEEAWLERQHGEKTKLNG